MSGTLYVVATPIGHLGDISRRGIDTLNHVGIIAAEDTRRTRVLLQHIDHTGCELVSVHEHNEERMGPVLIERMRQGTDIALVSDAGTPVDKRPGLSFVAARVAGWHSRCTDSRCVFHHHCLECVSDPVPAVSVRGLLVE
jgi:16S rRNA (cytidine1402-2'-O)-methyltransferase